MTRVLAPAAADLLARYAAELRRCRSGRPAEFVLALEDFRRAAESAGVGPGELLAAERALLGRFD